MKKIKDHRPYPEGRKRVYLSPAHMDMHCGDSGFYVEILHGTVSLGYYNKEIGVESARAVNAAMYRSIQALSRKAAKQFGESCGNGVCERAMEKRLKRV